MLAVGLLALQELVVDRQSVLGLDKKERTVRLVAPMDMLGLEWG